MPPHIKRSKEESSVFFFVAIRYYSYSSLLHSGHTQTHEWTGARYEIGYCNAKTVYTHSRLASIEQSKWFSSAAYTSKIKKKQKKQSLSCSHALREQNVTDLRNEANKRKITNKKFEEETKKNMNFYKSLNELKEFEWKLRCVGVFNWNNVAYLPAFYAFLCIFEYFTQFCVECLISWCYLISEWITWQKTRILCKQRVETSCHCM